jgi:hypothetical protein
MFLCKLLENFFSNIGNGMRINMQVKAKPPIREKGYRTLSGWGFRNVIKG